jgi:hypothetical protein
MRQGWKGLALGATLALCALAALPLATPRDRDLMAAAKASTPRDTKAKSGQRHAELKTSGDLAKDARVTVYYRDEGGQAVATRVVVKPEAAGPVGER